MNIRRFLVASAVITMALWLAPVGAQPVIQSDCAWGSLLRSNQSYACEVTVLETALVTFGINWRQDFFFPPPDGPPEPCDDPSDPCQVNETSDWVSPCAGAALPDGVKEPKEGTLHLGSCLLDPGTYVISGTWSGFGTPGAGSHHVQGFATGEAAPDGQEPPPGDEEPAPTQEDPASAPQVGNIAACADGLNPVVVGDRSATPSVPGEWLTLVGFPVGTHTVTSGSRSATVTVQAHNTQAPSEEEWGSCTPASEVLGVQMLPGTGFAPAQGLNSVAVRALVSAAMVTAGWALRRLGR